MNASPAGDTLPVLLALDAELVVGGPAGERTIPAAEFWPAYRQTARPRRTSCCSRVRIPIVDGRRQAFRKVGTRRAQAISKVVLAASWRRDPGLARRPDRARVRRRDADPRVGRPRPRSRARRRPPPPSTRPWTPCCGELHPIDDVRSTAAYRLEVSGRILRRLLEEAE